MIKDVGKGRDRKGRTRGRREEEKRRKGEGD